MSTKKAPHDQDEFPVSPADEELFMKWWNSARLKDYGVRLDIITYVEAQKPIFVNRCTVFADSVSQLSAESFSQPSAPLPIPPGWAEALVVLFAPSKRVDAILGDLSERFAQDTELKGKRQAELLYWARSLRSVGPLLWIKIKRAGVFVVIYEIGRRWIG